MTSPTSVELAKPSDWQHFERLTRALFSEAKRADFVRFGRSGQRQNGIDVIGRLSDQTVIGVQCKGRSSSLGKRLTKKTIDDAIKDAETFPDRLDEFFIVTTADEEVTLQQYVLQLSGIRQAAGKFSVTLWGWQSISDQIRSSPGVMRTFYREWWTKPSFKFVASAIAVAALLATVSLVSSERIEQWFALKDANQHTTVEGAQAVVVTLNNLETAYVDCISSMNGKAFIFSQQLRDKCVKPIDSPLGHLEKQRDELAGVMNADAFDEVVSNRPV